MKIKRLELGTLYLLVVIKVVGAKFCFLRLVDFKIKQFAIAIAPIANQSRFGQQSRKTLNVIGTRDGIGSKTHEMTRLLLAINEFKVVLGKKLMQMIESNL